MPRSSQSQELSLNGWTSLTTRLLKEGGPFAYCVMDDPFRSYNAADTTDDSSDSDSDNYSYHKNNDCCCKNCCCKNCCCSSCVQSLSVREVDLASKLVSEFRSTGRLAQLQKQPAKTTGDAKLHELLSILCHNTLTKDLILSSQTTTTTETSRGDYAIFLQEHRRRQDHSGCDSFLQQLVHSVERTCEQQLRSYINFELERTSVQLAEYPINDTTGYPRHLDTANHPPNNNNNNTHLTTDRILTVVYYLTPEEWDARYDHGCLRIYTTTKENSNAEAEPFVDIVPYRNRMVIFRSDTVEHQVLPRQTTTTTATSSDNDNAKDTTTTTTTRQQHQEPRRAITIWLYGRLRQQQKQQKARKDVSKQVQQHQQQHPVPLPINAGTTTNNTNNNTATIFVNLAAYRDSETGPTIRNLFETALYPHRIVVGLVLQVVLDSHAASATATTKTHQRQELHCRCCSSSTARITTEDLCYDKYQVWQKLPTAEPYWKQVRCMTLDAATTSTGGPCLARSLCQTGLYKGEDYVLQIDSHMRFRPQWDVYLIEQLQHIEQQQEQQALRNKEQQDTCQQSKVMLTTYPIGYELPNRIPNDIRPTVLVPWKFDSDGMLRQRGRFVEQQPQLNNNNLPICHYLYAAGFNFARGPAVIQDCPYPSHLQLFFGEEMYMATRLFQAGYNLYAPSQAVCYHLWTRNHRPPPLAHSSNTPCSHCCTRRNQQQQEQQQQRQTSIQTVQAMLTPPTTTAAVTTTTEKVTNDIDCEAGSDRLEEQLERSNDGAGQRSINRPRDVAAFARAIGVDFPTKTILDPNHQHRRRPYKFVTGFVADDETTTQE